MGITDFFSDLMSSMSFQEVQAEAPKEDEEKEEEGGDDDKKDEDKEEGEEKEGDAKEEGGEEEAEPEAEGEEEEEEEEDDEPVDIKPKLEEECARSHQCIGYKHHFDECVERVTEQHSDPDHKGPKEDCVEEFFHLQHCATSCAAPKLFKQLK